MNIRLSDYGAIKLTQGIPSTLSYFAIPHANISYAIGPYGTIVVQQVQTPTYLIRHFILVVNHVLSFSISEKQNAMQSIVSLKGDFEHRISTKQFARINESEFILFNANGDQDYSVLSPGKVCSLLHSFYAPSIYQELLSLFPVFREGLREELQQTKEELQEAEDYADKLEKEIEYIKENKFKLGNINIGELASVAMEGMIRRNPQFLTKLPGGEALAGIIVQDNQEQETKYLQQKAEPQPEATFQRKESGEQQFSEIEIRQLAFLNQLQEGFDAKQIEVFNIILGRLASEPSKLSEIATLFNINY